MTPLPHQMLSHYRLLEKVGEGGMGVVYAAWDTRLKRKVALKVLPEALAADPARLERFQREAEAVAALNHPNIVTIHSVEESGGTRFLTMEMVEGESLDHVVAAGGMPVPRLLDIGIALADALAAAHERGIVHRDLKPANVMLAKDDRVKVLDFGLAKLAEVAAGDVSQLATRQASITEMGVLGTAPYMSPEQLRAEAVDHRTDLFSLGVVLYELATGHRPFAGKSTAEIVSAILREPPVPVTVVRQELPRPLGRIITHCLQKDLRERFQSARDVCNELRQLRDEVRLEAPAVAQSPMTSTPPGPVGTQRPVMKNPWLLLAGAGTLVAAGTAVVWLTGSERGATPATGAEMPVDASPAASRTKVASIAVLPFVNMSGDAENEYFSDGLAEELLNALARNPSLRVPARTSSFSFKGKDTEIAEIGRRLNVATVLEGSVRKADKRVRITVQLINAADGYHIWSQTYDRQLEDIFAVQDDIARSVMTSLKATLPDTRAVPQHTGNTEAYNLVLKGRYFWGRWGPGDLQKARDSYEEALALDPDNAAAWQSLSITLGSMADVGEIDRKEGARLAREAVERALALDDSLPTAHAVLGFQKLAYDWDWAGAEAELAKALALEPQGVGPLSLAANLASVQGRLKEASELYRQIHEIDPLAAWTYNNSTIVLTMDGRLDEALSDARTLLELSPQRENVHGLIGRIHIAQGKPDAALQEYLLETSETNRLYGLVMAYHALGRKAESDAALASYLEKSQNRSPFSIACLRAFRGEPDEAFVWLERAYDERDRDLAWMKVDIDLVNLRDDARWLPFLRKMRLTG